MIKYFNHQQLSEKYAILGSLEVINIFSVEPNIDKVFEIKKPHFIKEIVIPDAQIGIGGLPEKLMAAERAGIKTVFIPKDNVEDLKDVAKEVLDKLEIVPVSEVSEVLKKLKLYS